MPRHSNEHRPPLGGEGEVSLVRRSDAPRGATVLTEFLDTETSTTSTAGIAGFSLSALLRNRWLILGVFALTFALTAPWIWLFVKPMYQARAIVQVSSSVPRIVFNTENNGMIPLYQSYLNTQVSKIRGRKVIERVLDHPMVQKTSWYRHKPLTLRSMLGGEPPSRMELLREVLEVAPRRNTELIDVSMLTLEPTDAKAIVDVVVDEYRRVADEEMEEHERQVFEKLRAERRALQNEIEGQTESIGNISKRVGTSDPDIVRAQLAEQRSVLSSERERLSRTHEMTRWELEWFDRVSNPDASPKDSGAAVAGEGERGKLELRVSDDPEWRRLSLELEKLRHDLNVARQQFGDFHPRIKELVAGVEHGESILQQREQQVLEQWHRAPHLMDAVAGRTDFSSTRLSLERTVQRQAKELELIDQQLRELEQDQEQKGELAKQLARYDQQLRHKRELFEAVHQRLTALEMEEKAPGRISIADYAVTSTLPDHDRRGLLTALAFGFAAALALAVGYLRCTMDTRILGADEVAHAVRAPFLGQLPLVADSGHLLDDHHPALMESVRMVRTALLERVNQTGTSVVLITSSSSRSGKTTLAVLLAKSLALLGKKTLLVEGDLRRPSIAERLHLPSVAGLAAVLAGAADEDSAIVATGVPKFDVLVAGKCPPGFNSELLADGVFRTCLQQWKKKYDFVLLDSPPVLPVADSRILAGQADGTILVLRAAHCRRAEVIQAYADLSAAGGRLLGTVLVGARLGAGYSYDYSYGGGYASGDDRAPVREQ